MTTPKLEIKILPDKFESSLNSNDKSITRAYRKWRGEDFLGWHTMGELKEELKKDKHYYSNEELLQIFPEAEPYLKCHLAELQKEQKSLESEIKNDLLKIYKTVKDDFSVWYYEKIVEVFNGERLNKLSDEIRKITWTLNPKKHENKNGKVTDEMIRRARDYPFDQLIKFNQAKKAICEFHNDTHPSMSFYQKKNRIKCFACGASFDTIGYIMETKKISFIDAVKYLNNY